LVDFTVQLLKNKEFAAKIGVEGKKFVKENFDWKNIVAKLDKVYEEIIK
ncbi:MAG: A-glycosyltransferase-related protein, glycosyltransferase family 4 protein, partial [Parcubacteria group bacterium GW2011_GWA1_38_7]